MHRHVRRALATGVSLLLALTMAACSGDSTTPTDTSNSSTPAGGTGSSCASTAGGTFSGTVANAPWTATCIQATIANGVLVIVATDQRTGVTLGIPSTGGTFTVGVTSSLTGEVGVGTSKWIVGGTGSSGTVTAVITPTSATGSVSLTYVAEPGTGATGTTTVVAKFNLTF